ncbi:hypothetical protein [Paraglaciecola arctica]|uniref:hypothetical protein n=1 Tax=Paraglaciecola arctica TaxID=1128911 RepID=UPI001C07B33E|nr:hypothetical protein [Paraglaciecola arctica]MBU3003553.1 hypothetical protein [Paraglaciecola arctica]
MNYLVCIFLLFTGLSGCALNEQNGLFTQSSVQTVDMGKFNGLRIIEIAAFTYPETSTQTQTTQVFTDKDKNNFSDSLLQSLKRSDVRVLPSAQTKIHIDITQLVILEERKGTIITMTANLAISRNGIVTRKTIEITSKPKFTISATKDNGVKMFIQELGELLREQSSFKS